MKIYFSFDSAPDKEMMEEIKNIHQTALNQFKTTFLSDTQLDTIKNYPLEIHLNTRMKSKGGSAIFNKTTKKVKIQIHYRLHVENQNSLKDTYLHELGHIIEFICFNQSSHDYRWQKITEELGGTSARTHSMDTSKFKSKRKKFEYVCNCSTMHMVSSIKHNKILKGYKYHCLKCKTTIKAK